MPRLGATQKRIMIVATGIDLVDLERLRALLESDREAFVTRIFTDAERAYCESRTIPLTSFAARFAAKEAVMKCLRTGWSSGVGFRQIEVLRSEAGDVRVALSGRAAEVAAALGIARIHLSLSHTSGQAVAMAVAEGP
jgi:holo-[acyl-carrier protein] synthase